MDHIYENQLQQKRKPLLAEWAMRHMRDGKLLPAEHLCLALGRYTDPFVCAEAARGRYSEPFVYAEEAKELIDDSLKYGVFKTKNEAIFKLHQSINPAQRCDYNKSHSERTEHKAAYHKEVDQLEEHNTRDLSNPPDINPVPARKIASSVFQNLADSRMKIPRTGTTGGVSDFQRVTVPGGALTRSRGRESAKAHATTQNSDDSGLDTKRRDTAGTIHSTVQAHPHPGSQCQPGWSSHKIQTLDKGSRGDTQSHHPRSRLLTI
ncbi:hypothetical protein ACU8KH_01725 [Lachancea thermotolerans]